MKTRGNDGSPPQVRGKHPAYMRHLAVFRITPAGAGKTGADKHRSCGKKDHPRRCGENVTSSPLRRSTAGSPPQVRGKHAECVTGNAVFGITPAGAGKTQVLADGGNSDEDHPRRCGENTKKIL